MKNDTSVDLYPVVTQRASEVIYNQIKELILSGKLKPGNTLPSEREMMRSFKRSRPTIREALRMLEHSGFICIVAGTMGAVVQDFDTQSLERSLQDILHAKNISLNDLAEYRKATEVEVVKWASQRRTQDDLDKLKQILDASEKHLKVIDYDEFIKTDVLFHAQVAEAAKNELAQVIIITLRNVISDLNKNFFERMFEIDQRNFLNKIYSAHILIFDAISDKDETRASEAMANHLQAFMDDLSAYL